MTVRLDPPPVPPLSPAQRTRLRNRVMAASAPAARERRRWVTPLLAAAAVGAVITGTLVVADERPADQPPTAAEGPAASIDRGPLTPADQAAAAKVCPKLRGEDAQVLWGRRIQVPHGDAQSSVDRFVVFKADPDPKKPDSRSGVRFCTPFDQWDIPDSKWSERLTPDKGQIELAGQGTIISSVPGKGAGQAYVIGSFRRVRPDITRLQARLVLNDGRTTSKWRDVAVAGGFTYVSLTVPLTGPDPRSTADENGRPTLDLDIELRTFDSAGNPVPVPE